ncbi:Sugar phosphate isomerase/epimerase [Pseudonocardia sp. Ae168_Ps1]|uniref:sugar phosphate isomerase/epimerase family protein n=1 Tax=unclassified Pseudonocardia TaxID=2619320 RepID=UPI000960597B|nr:MULTISPECIES: sugar phosphate isomerase/epimerase [unclassified Pseudonocardia]OLL74302.1 Sugar phosphate isomerase/epimerase [Pseudonocardia sp. Ae150A_Ps1]OLL80284.1 Sugar phosphate isomerase/epimerase [Pseudonocardia sp. Ae168_Ps1]
MSDRETTPRHVTSSPLPGSAIAPLPVPVALSTASVYPEGVAAGFEIAAELGYDGVELMIWTDPVSQDPRAIERLAHRHGVPVLAVHAPCLAVTQRVWGADPVHRLRRTVEVAARLGARTVVVHPPFRWQRRYADVFGDEVARAFEHDGVTLPVENMFPVKRGSISTVPYALGHDPTDIGYGAYTLDLSHTAAAEVDALDLMARMGDRLTHLHLTDGSGAPRDEHLVPGRGAQPCAEVCQALADGAFARDGGTVVLEVSTRRCRTRQERAGLLAESLLFARLHLAPTVPAGVGGSR